MIVGCVGSLAGLTGPIGVRAAELTSVSASTTAKFQFMAKNPAPVTVSGSTVTAGVKSIRVSFPFGTVSFTDSQLTIGPCPSWLTATVGGAAAHCYISGTTVSVTLPDTQATIAAGTAFSVEFAADSIDPGSTNQTLLRTITVSTYNGTHFDSSAVDTASVTLAWPETVTFNANQGSGTMSVQSSSSAQALTLNTFTRTGYRFDGWAAYDGGPLLYADGATYPFTSSTTLYARWVQPSVRPDPVFRTFVTGTVGTPIETANFIAEGFLSPVTTFSIRTGTLPAGLTLTKTGDYTAEIAGTPTGEGNGCFDIDATNGTESAGTSNCVIISIAPGEATTTTSATPPTTVTSPTTATTTTLAGGATATTIPSSDGTTTTVAGSAQAPTLVTAENQEILTATVGTAKILIDGELVEVDLVQAPEALRRTAAGARTFAEVRALQTLAQDMVAAVQAVVGAGVTLPITISNTSTGATITGLVNDPVTGLPMAVPVEDVLLIVNDKLALMVGGADGANDPANIAFDGVIEFGQGGYVAVLAYGLTPGQTGEVVVMSTPQLLKEFEVADDGSVAAQAQVPTDIAPGDHTVVVTVGDQAASLGFRVLAPGVLPSTGVDSTPLPWAVLVLAAGGLAVLAVTRRRTVV